MGYPSDNTMNQQDIKMYGTTISKSSLDGKMMSYISTTETNVLPHQKNVFPMLKNCEIIFKIDTYV